MSDVDGHCERIGYTGRRKFTSRHGDGKVERRIVKGAKEFGEVLAFYFGIVPEDPADLGIAAAVAEERAAQPDFFERSQPGF